MLSRCGNYVVNVLMVCGFNALFSATNEHNYTPSRRSIHSTSDLSATLHKSFHNVCIRCIGVFTHRFHSTYNYNNLYKENCV